MVGKAGDVVEIDGNGDQFKCCFEDDKSESVVYAKLDRLIYASLESQRS